MASIPPLTIRCGEPFDVTVPVLDAAGVAVPAASIATARVQVRVRPAAPEVLHEWSTTTGSPPNAQITTGGIRLLATATETLAWQDAWSTYTPQWDLLVVDSDGAPHYPLDDPQYLLLQPALTR